MPSTPFELKNIVVRAGAGAGKTTELTERVIGMAEAFEKQHQHYPRLIVTTFTRKATQELKERLLKKAMELRDPGLVRFVKSPSRLHISTIHGILSLFLNKYGTIIGLSPRFKIISDRQNQILVKKKLRELCEKNSQFNQAFQALLEVAEFQDILQGFSQFFDHQIEFESMSPATGKEFAALIEKKSRDLLKDIQKYADEISRAGLPEAWLNLSQYLNTLVDNSSKMRDSAPWFQFWSSADQSMPSVKKSKDMGDEWQEQKKKISKEISNLTEWNCQIGYWEEHQFWVQQFAYCSTILSQALYEEKIKRAELTMQDLEVISLRMIRQHPEAAMAFAKTCDYWFIDEFQDTSPIQVELLKHLSHGTSSFIVGDPQQSIYLFRGARSEVFDDREKSVHQSGGELLEKMVNYRSRPELLEFFNHFFTEISSQFKPMKPKSQPSSENENLVAEILIAREIEDSDIDGELMAVIFRCQELIKQGARPEDICVLSRNNQDLEEIVNLAKKYDLPVQKHSSGQFFERREIIDACSLLKFLCNPHDNLNLIRLLRSPEFYVDDQTIYEYSQKSQKSFWLTFKEIPCEAIETLQAALAGTRSQGIGVTWRDLLIKKEFFKTANAMDASGQREANLWKLVHLVLTKERASGFSHLEFLNNLDLSSQNTEEQDQGDGIPVVEPAKVHLMTVHASKGLQFDHIIFARLGRDIPHPRTQFYMMDETKGLWTLALSDPEEGKKVASLLGKEILKNEKDRTQAESDRVLYVALTRARHSVSLIMGETHDANSWAARWPLEKSEGLHRQGPFTYRVRHQNFQPDLMPTAKRNVIPEISTCDLKLKSSRQSISVTALLEQQSRKSESGDQRESSVEEGFTALKKAMGGVEIHRLFESLKYHWLNNSDFDWHSLLPDLTDIQKSALQFVAKDESGKWLEIIRQGEVEDGIAVMKDNFLIQGQIDLWGRDLTGQAWVVDYKTGSERHLDKAFSQLEIYTWALRKMKKLSPDEIVKIAVIYPLSEKTYIRDAEGFSEA